MILRRSTHTLVRRRQRAVSAALAVLLATVPACSVSRPPRPVAVAPRPPLHGANADPGVLTLPLDGDYIATFKAPLLGEISGRITATPTPDGFEARTRRGVAWDMIGGLERLFGPIFASSIFPGGSILVWTSGLPTAGDPGPGTLGPGNISGAQVRTRITAANAPVELYSPDGRRVATMTLRRPGDSGSPGPDQAAAPVPSSDYPALAEGVEDAVRARLFDRSLVTSSRVRAFVHQLKSNARKSRDDVEFIFGAIVAGRANVPFALPLVFKALDPDWKSQVTSLADAGLATYRVTYEDSSGIATLRCEAFLDAADVDRAFRQVLSHKPRALLIDLRGCPGVTLASLRLASWVIDQPQDAGTFFGPAMRDAAKAGHAGEFPRLALDSAASVEEIERALDAGGGARVVIIPEPDRFKGPVAVLTTRRTTTSAESLVWTLKAAAIASTSPTASDDAPTAARIRLFGQPTAGRATLSRPIDIGQGWVVWLAALDYLPPRDLRRERPERGCRPHEENASRELSKKAAGQWLKEQSAPGDGSPSGPTPQP